MGLTVICIDEDEHSLDNEACVCCEAFAALSEQADVQKFNDGADAIVWLTESAADVVLIDMGKNPSESLDLGKRVKELYPDISVIFLADSDKFAYEALKLHASGYLLKPCSKEDLYKEFDHVILTKQKNAAGKVLVQTFGEFNVFVDGKVVNFSRSKSKELLAFLIDRQGGNMARGFIFSALWEDRAYDRSMQKQLDVIIRSLRQTLLEYGISDIVELSKGQMRACPERFSCDLYQLFAGKKNAIDSYRGEYMSAYSWASTTEAYIDRILGEM
jgi:two-component SAPR family response regulator